MEVTMYNLTKLAATSRTAKANAKKALKRTSQASQKAYNNTRKWIANIDKQSIKQYLAIAWKVSKNGGRKCSTYLKDSYKLARSKKYHQSNVYFINAVACLGLTIKAGFLTCSELLIVTQVLRRLGYVKTTPHNLLINTNTRIESLSGSAAINTINKIRSAIGKALHSSASNTNSRGYSFLSAGIKPRKSA